MIPFIVLQPEYIWAGLIVSGIIILTLFLGKASLPRKIFIGGNRVLLIMLLCLAASQPLLLDQTTSLKTINMQVLYDNSSSMKPFDLDIHDIKEELNVETSLNTITQDDRSDIINQLYTQLKPFGLYLLISDGQDTQENDYSTLVAEAQRLNATFYTYNLEDDYADMGVLLQGPDKTLAGAQNTFAARVTGNTKLPAKLEIVIDGNVMGSTQNFEEPLYVSHIFKSEGVRSIEARLSINDTFEQNNIYHMTTRVVPKPNAFYIGRDSRTQQFLSRFFELDTGVVLPEDLSPYHTIITQNANINSLSAQTLEPFVAQGNGLTLFGGANSFDFGNYDASDIAPLLPVKTGRSGPKARATIIFVVDVSGSRSDSSDAKLAKEIAYDIVGNIGGDNLVGVIAYDSVPYLVSDLTLLSQGRDALLDKISRLNNQIEGGRGTRHSVGLAKGVEMASQTTGEVAIIMIADGQLSTAADTSALYELQNQVRDSGYDFYAIKVGERIKPIDYTENEMVAWSTRTQGTFLRAEENDRLSITFGKNTDQQVSSNQFGVSVSDQNHPITFDLSNPEARLTNINAVLPKPGARALAVTTQGDVALTTWNYGLGRVGTWTAYSGLEDLGGFLSGQDSVILTRMLTWSAGDPERKTPPLISISDTQQGEFALVQANAASLQELADRLQVERSDLDRLNLINVEPEIYQGKYLVNDVGIRKEFGTIFAAHYPQEYAFIGQSPVMEQLAEQTGGKHLNFGDLDRIADIVREQRTSVQTSVSLVWLCITIALSLFTIEIVVRRALEYMRKV